MQIKEERKEYQKKWRENHKEEISIKGKEYRKNNREKLNEYAREYRENNKDKISEYAKEWNKNHKEEKNEKAKEYREKNKEEILEKQKEYHKNNKEEISIKAKKYRENHKEETNKRHNNRIKTDVNYKLACYLRGRLRSAIKNNYKSGSAVRDLGCSIPQLRIYLESKFQPGMTWDNWSYKGWHIDHIIPLSSFDLTIREELLKAVYFTNLQPLWAKDNFIKHNKII